MNRRVFILNWPNPSLSSSYMLPFGNINTRSFDDFCWKLVNFQKGPRQGYHVGYDPFPWHATSLELERSKTLVYYRCMCFVNYLFCPNLVEEVVGKRWFGRPP